MDDHKLESLAVKEIIEEIEGKKRIELVSQRPPVQRQVRPNKQFLGRTIVSVLQHNRRQHAQEKRNSFRKLRELDKQAGKSASTSKGCKRSLAKRQQVEVETFSNGMHMDLPMYFLNNMNHLLNKVQKDPKPNKEKQKNDILTIDLTKKKKRAKEKKQKQKDRLKKIKSKKRRRRKQSSSSNASSSSLTGGSISSISDDDQSHTLLIDLT